MNAFSEMVPDLFLRFLTVVDLVSPFTFKDGDPIANAVNQAGYSLQIHDIVTEDGYHLRMHRISAKPVEGAIKNESILMLHGLMANSAQYVVHPDNESMAFKLVQAGHDIWILHARGISYSLAAETKDYNSSEYWDFSFHELGYHDVPCAIDYILKATNKKKIHYIGHSQGGTALLVALSTRPEYNEKIASAYLLTPGAYGTESEGIDFLLGIGDRMEALGFHQIRLRNKVLEGLAVSFCGNRLTNRVCVNLILKMIGQASSTLDLYNFSMWLVKYVGDNAATKQIIHYKQLFQSGKFQMFDYGPDNMQRYGSDTPPEYNLTLIEVPITLMSADKDELVSSKGTAKLAANLKNVRKNWIISGNHLDFMYDPAIISMIIDDVLTSMKNY